MNELMANFQQSALDARSTTKGVGDGRYEVSDQELEGLVGQLAQMTGPEQNEAIDHLRKTDPQLRALLRSYQPIAPAQR